MADPLATVLRIRRVTVDDAKRALAAALAVEEEARHHADSAEAAISAERAVASDVSAGDAAVEAFAAWLPLGRSRAAETRAAQEGASAAVAMQRAALSAARAAAAAAEALLDRRAAERAVLAGRRAQAEVDEVAGRPRPDPMAAAGRSARKG